MKLFPITFVKLYIHIQQKSNGRGTVLKQFLAPIVLISEWILFFIVSLFVFTFNMIHFTNVLFVDMAWEKPVTVTTSTASFFQIVLLVIGVSCVCFVYTNYFAGTGVYKRFKAYAWGTLFAVNAIACFSYLLVSYDLSQLDLRNMELSLLLIVFLASVVLTIQIMTKSSETYD